MTEEAWNALQAQAWIRFAAAGLLTPPREGALDYPHQRAAHHADELLERFAKRFKPKEFEPTPQPAGDATFGT